MQKCDIKKSLGGWVPPPPLVARRLKWLVHRKLVPSDKNLSFHQNLFPTQKRGSSTKQCFHLS